MFSFFCILVASSSSIGVCDCFNRFVGLSEPGGASALRFVDAGECQLLLLLLKLCTTYHDRRSASLSLRRGLEDEVSTVAMTLGCRSR